MLRDSDEKKMKAAILRGQESAGSLKPMRDPNFFGHVDTILHSFSTCLSLLESSSNQSNKKRKKRFGEGGLVRDSPTMVINEDGFSWVQYGNKSIKNSPHPRKYYECRELNCDARKHIQKTQDSPPNFRTTYDGQHMCQAQLFLDSVQEQDNGSSRIVQSDQASNEHQETNQNTNQDLLNDNFWVSDELEMMFSHNDYHLDQF